MKKQSLKFHNWSVVEAKKTYEKCFGKAHHWDDLDVFAKARLIYFFKEANRANFKPKLRGKVGS